MASMILSLFNRKITKLPTLHQLSSRSPAGSSSSGYYSQMVDGLEEREIREFSIKHWLYELKGVAYDAEDVVEEFEYEVLRYKLASEEEQNDSFTDQQRQIVERRCEVSDLDVPPPCAPPHDAAFRQKILDKTKKINHQFDEIYGDAHKLGLHEEAGLRRGGIDVFKPPRRLPSSSLTNEQEVRGRDDDKHELIKMLSGSATAAADGSRSEESVRVVFIVGMGGIGKMTFALFVYNLMRKYFEAWVWVCVSEPDSWSLFEKSAFGGGRRSGDYPNLMKIGRQIVRKCDGLVKEGRDVKEGREPSAGLPSPALAKDVPSSSHTF